MCAKFKDYLISEPLISLSTYSCPYYFRMSQFLFEKFYSLLLVALDVKPMFNCQVPTRALCRQVLRCFLICIEFFLLVAEYVFTSMHILSRAERTLEATIRLYTHQFASALQYTLRVLPDSVPLFSYQPPSPLNQTKHRFIDLKFIGKRALSE